MNHQIFCELKEFGEDGSFKGIASVQDVEDLQGDIIERGAFLKTLQENPRVPVLWQHDATEVIGLGTVKEWGAKVMLDGQLDMDDPVAAKAHRKMKRGMVRGLSIGFSVPEGKSSRNEKTGVRHIHEVKLWEVSLVTFAAHPQAQITSVKSSDGIDERLTSLESQISALSAELATAKAAGTGEPAAKEQPTPVEDHSAALSIIDSIRSRMIA